MHRLFVDELQVVFQDGEGAMQVLPPLIGIVPEAKQNLTISYLNSGNKSDLANNLHYDYCIKI